MCLWLLLFKHEIHLIVFHPEEKRVFLMIRPATKQRIVFVLVKKKGPIYFLPIMYCFLKLTEETGS